MKTQKIITFIVLIPLGIGLVYVGRAVYEGTMTIRQLLTENKELKQAITNLTTEEQIGYAKVIRQEPNDGRLFTTLRFVETDRDDKLHKILEKEYTIEGDIVHFDALIVKFGPQMVMDGKARAMYLWRRVYGEKMTPEQGFAIESVGQESARYADLFKLMPAEHRQLFWQYIWDLAESPDALKEYDIQAIYGNVVYTRLRPGLIYVFQINPSGQVWPQIVPEL
jgi:hypothetical protein